MPGRHSPVCDFAKEDEDNPPASPLPFQNSSQNNNFRLRSERSQVNMLSTSTSEKSSFQSALTNERLMAIFTKIMSVMIIVIPFVTENEEEASPLCVSTDNRGKDAAFVYLRVNCEGFYTM